MEGMRFVNNLSSLSFRTNGLMFHPTFKSPARGKVQPSRLPNSRGGSRGVTPKLALEAIHAQPEVGFRERARFKTDIWTIKVKPPGISSYFLESTTEVDILVDKLIGLDKGKVRINGIEYDKMDAIERLMNLKVLLRREDLLRARIRMIAEAIKKEEWDDVKRHLKVLRLPVDVEAFLVTAIIYKVTRGRSVRKTTKFVESIYPQNSMELMPLVKMYLQFIKKTRKRTQLRNSRDLRERLIGLVWEELS